jgi:hypothetical protein
MEYVLLAQGQYLFTARVVYGSKIVKLKGHPKLTSISRDEWNYAIAIGFSKGILDYIGEV